MEEVELPEEVGPCVEAKLSAPKLTYVPYKEQVKFSDEDGPCIEAKLTAPKLK